MLPQPSQGITPCTHLHSRYLRRHMPTAWTAQRAPIQPLAVEACAAAPQAGIGPGSAASSVVPTIPPCPLDGRFMLPAPEVQRLLGQRGVSMEQFLSSLIRPASRLARPPVSGYCVGAAGLGASGAIYIGVNLEFPGAPLNNSVHAEQFLVVNSLHHGEQSLRMLAVSAAPCGHCRQFFAELYRADEVSFLFGKETRPRLLEELLPGRFGPQDLADEPFPLLLQPHANRVTYSLASQNLLESRAPDLALVQAASDALQEATTAYSPYTKCPSGAAIITRDGRVFSGGCIESAAYNPSLSPFHAAYIHAVTGGMHDAGEIREVVLAEVAGAPVRHQHSIQLLLDNVAPDATLTVLGLERQP